MIRSAYENRWDCTDKKRTSYAAALREEEEDRLNSSLGGVERGDDASAFLVKESILEKEHWGMPTFSLSSLVMSGEVVLAFFGE